MRLLCSNTRQAWPCGRVSRAPPVIRAASRGWRCQTWFFGELKAGSDTEKQVHRLPQSNRVTDQGSNNTFGACYPGARRILLTRKTLETVSDHFVTVHGAPQFPSPPLLLRDSRHHRNSAWRRDRGESQCRCELNLDTAGRGLLHEGLAAGLVSADADLMEARALLEALA
jgi:hypothetical protein